MYHRNKSRVRRLRRRTKNTKKVSRRSKTPKKSRSLRLSRRVAAAAGGIAGLGAYFAYTHPAAPDTPTNETPPTATSDFPQLLYLENHGNTCYINVVIQLLYQIDEIRDSILACNGSEPLISYLNNVFRTGKITPQISTVITNFTRSSDSVRVGEFEPGRMADASELLEHIMELTSLRHIASVGYCLQEQFKFTKDNTSENQATIQLYSTPAISDYTASHVHDSTTFTKTTLSCDKKILDLKGDTFSSMQALIDEAQTDRPADDREQITNNPPSHEHVYKQDTYVNCKKWIVVRNFIPAQHIVNPFDDISLDGKTYALVGSIEHLPCHYMYHKMIENNEWVTFSDSVLYRNTPRERTASSYVFLYRQKDT